MTDLPEGWTDSSPFPELSLDLATMKDYLNQRLMEVPAWQEDSEVVRFGVPMGLPDPVGLETLALFNARNSNNVGVHSRFGDGAAGTRRLEKEALALLGGLFHGGALDGYVTSGATEAVIQAVRIGRATLRAAGTRPVVVASDLAHHSVAKAADLTDLPLTRVRATGPARSTSPADLAATLEVLYADGVTGYIVVSTIGYFGTGSVDDVPALCRVLADHRDRHPETRYYHHLDAAFGGLVLPFTDPGLAWDFRNRGVHSIAVDPHKTGLLAYTCGVFLCRKGLLDHVTISAPQSGGVDQTLLGSRSGAAAAALWAVLVSQGFAGFAATHSACVELRDELRNGLAELDPRAEFVGHPRLPVLAVSFGADGRRLPAAVEARYRLHAAPLPDGLGGQERDFYHFYVVPGHQRTHVKALLANIDEALRRPLPPKDLQEARLDPVVAAGSRATVCPRHVLVHPPGHRDPRRHPIDYSFHTFVPRRRTAELLRSRELRPSVVAGASLMLYAADLQNPFANELGGVTVDRHFQFEVLDRHQQFLSLIGAAHLTLHGPGRPGWAVANFNADGGFRSLEMRFGRAGFADELQVFTDSVVLKIGKSSKAVHRAGDDYSFSLDTAAEIRVALLDGDRPASVAYSQYNHDPLLPRTRHLPRALYRRFPNVFYGEVLKLETGRSGSLAWRDHPELRTLFPEGGLRQDSAVVGPALTSLQVRDERVIIEVRSERGTDGYRLDVPVGLGRDLTESLPRLDVSDPERLSADAVADHAESLYRSLQEVVHQFRPNAIT